MSQKEYQQFISRELEELNSKIDLKIVWGLHYENEAKRHKMLRSEISKIKKQKIRTKILSYFPFNHVRRA